jgi:hypothetical protein
VSVRYFASHDDEGTPLALFRIMSDDDAQTLDMEYLTADGTWKNDPTVIDEIREPGVAEIQPADAPDIADALTGGKEAEAVASSAAADAADERGTGPMKPPAAAV